MHFPSNIIGQLLRFYQEELKDYYELNEIKALLFIIFEEYTGWNKTELMLNFDKSVSESTLLKIHFAVKELKKQKPVQYILGKTSFYGLDFIVSPDVLIPRPETEELVKLVLDDLSAQNNTSKLKILDIGTGSGCIPVTLKKHLPDAEIFAIDISGEALEIAAKNAKKYNVQVNYQQIDIFDKTKREKLPVFDIIISNPPYVRKSEKQQMDKNVLDYEPGTALFVDDSNPLIFYKAIAEFSEKHLSNNGKVYLEVNKVFGKETGLLFSEIGEVEVLKDINGKERFLRVFA